MSDTGRAAHWDERYLTVGAQEVSWYELHPTTSLDLLDTMGVTPADAVIDVGGGASTLVDHLLARGHDDLTVLDLSDAALTEARRRTREAAAVRWITADLLTWEPTRQWDVWHDRAVLHFMTTDAERATYARVLADATRPGSVVVLGAFAPDGPTHCSGLEVRRQGVADLLGVAGELEQVQERRQLHRTPGGGEQSFLWVAGRRR